jgi:molybdenum cofactor synthesis domain-containing protein
MKPSIALLATGDEIVEGDVINTASPAIAQVLKPLGIPITTQMACDDQQSEITNALRYLLQDHSIVIITGGLGPTCDDRTRYALAEVIDEELELNEESWKRVYDHIFKFRGEVPENNKQQSLFPKSAAIIPNTTGTADGCHVTFEGREIYMLPGPPSQSLPMAEHYITNHLTSNNHHTPSHRASWMLLNASESHLATLVDKALGDHANHIDVGYRFNPPYLQFKLKATQPDHLEKAYQLLSTTIEAYIWQQGQETALEHLQKWIDNQNETLFFEDKLTQGKLNQALVSHTNTDKIFFAPNQPIEKPNVTITIQAPKALYKEIKAQDYYFEFTWQLVIERNGKIILDESFTHRLSRHFAEGALVEWIAIELLNNIRQQANTQTL